MSSTDQNSNTPARADGLRRMLAWAEGAKQWVLTCHVHADPDAIGSEAAVAAWLEARGARVTIINPTPIPESLRWLLHRPDLDAQPDSEAAAAAIGAADRFLVLDTAEPKRVGPLAPHLPSDRTWVLDHHVAGPERITANEVRDPTAAATGELVYELIDAADGPWPAESVVAIYVALVGDTGSFRFSNTTPKTHRIAADLLARGVEPEAVYRKLFAVVPPSRLVLLREVLGTLRQETDAPITSLVVTRDMIERSGASDDDVEGLSEHARSLRGTEIAVVLRETRDGQTKVSFRSNGDADVASVAREFGGGGHVKAAGATLPGTPEAALPQAIAAARRALQGGAGGTFP